MIEKGVCSGQGGQGMVLIGELIAKASLKEGIDASVYPSYGPEIRGGAAHSSYVVSDSAIANPVVADFDVALIMNNFSMAQFVCSKERDVEREDMKKKGIRMPDRMLRSGGLLIYNSSLILPEEVPERDDLRVYSLPASELTNSKIPNMVLMGAYMQVQNRPKVETLEEIFKDVFTGYKAKFVEPNLRDITLGMDYVKDNYP